MRDREARGDDAIAGPNGGRLLRKQCFAEPRRCDRRPSTSQRANESNDRPGPVSSVRLPHLVAPRVRASLDSPVRAPEDTRAHEVARGRVGEAASTRTAAEPQDHKESDPTLSELFFLGGEHNAATAMPSPSPGTYTEPPGHVPWKLGPGIACSDSGVTIISPPLQASHHATGSPHPRTTDPGRKTLWCDYKLQVSRNRPHRWRLSASTWATSGEKKWSPPPRSRPSLPPLRRELTQLFHHWSRVWSGSGTISVRSDFVQPGD